MTTVRSSARTRARTLRPTACAIFTLAAWNVFGCQAPDVEEVPSEAPGAAEPAARRALIVGLDGVRGDVARAAYTPAMDSMMAGGAGTYDGRTHATGETSSVPGWASVLTGLEPEKTGALTNDLVVIPNRNVSTILEEAHDSDRSVGIAAHWIGIPPLANVIADDTFLGDDDGVTNTALTWISDPRLDVVFVQLDDVDAAGHGAGFAPSTPAYIAAIERADRRVLQLLDQVSASEDAWLVWLVSDHGGVDTDHGPRVPSCEVIPLAASAPEDTTFTLPGSPTHLDVAPTTRAWLGLPALPTDGTSWITSR